ncbi:Probable chitinase 10 [Eumeta japonica]|uniref:Probable chitinase 10 n=1 Tax=Eumeta variegata TaxID=151549 RepID=A0A4C1Y281_EUMVA|nr:Probable chitinase 10 [Eumeta japonica]
MNVALALFGILWANVALAEQRKKAIFFPNDNGCPEDPSIDKLLPHENCNQFYKCTFGDLVLFDCYPGTLFNVQTDRCDWPEEVDCGDRLIPGMQSAPTTEAPSPTQTPEDINESTQAPIVTEDDNESVLFPNDNNCPEDPSVDKLLPHENCNQFYKCTFGKLVPFFCVPGTLFNVETMRCDWPEEVDCGDRQVPGDTDNPPATETPSPTQAPDVTEDNNESTQAPIVTEDDNESVLFPNDNNCPEDPSVDKLLPHENCNQFYKCTFGELVPFFCVPGTLFNVETMRCDWPEEVDCGDRLIPDDTVNPPATDAPSPTQAPTATEDNNTPTQAPVVTEDDNESTLSPNDNVCPEDYTVEKLLPHENCNQFYKCAHGEPVAMSCWPGLLFNPETMRCDWPEEVDCGDRLIPDDIVNPPATDAPSPTQAPTVTENNNTPTQAPVVTEDDNESTVSPNDNACPEDYTVDKLLPHENCNQFYKCAYGEPVAMSCWPGLLFNPETLRCDWPEEVDCGDRLIPDDIVNPPATDAPSPTSTNSNGE